MNIALSKYNRNIYILGFIQIVKFFVELSFKETVQEPSVDLIKRCCLFKYEYLTFLEKFFHNKRIFDK